MAAVAAERAVDALQSVVTVLAAAGAGKPVAGMSLPALPASPRLPTAMAGPLAGSDPQAPAIKVAGAAPDLSPPLTSKPGPPLWAGPWKPASSSEGAGLPSVSPPPLRPAHLEATDPSSGPAGVVPVPPPSEAVLRLTNQGRCPCLSVCWGAPPLLPTMAVSSPAGQAPPSSLPPSSISPHADVANGQQVPQNLALAQGYTTQIQAVLQNMALTQVSSANAQPVPMGRPEWTHTPQQQSH